MNMDSNDQRTYNLTQGQATTVAVTEQTRSTPFVLNRATAWAVRPDSRITRTNRHHRTTPVDFSRDEHGWPGRDLGLRRLQLLN